MLRVYIEDAVKNIKSLGYFTVLMPQTVIYAAIASVILAVILSLAPVVFAYRLDTGEQLK